jgi:hypothetical protein
MAEDLYVNKNGFKCVMSQLAKTDGRDPQEHYALKQQHRDDTSAFKAEVSKLKVRASQYAEN